MEVWRSGKSRTAYTAESCVTDEGIVVGEPTRRTGFPKLDLVLHRKIAEQSSSASVGACAVVTLLVSHFDCEVDSVAL